MIFIQTVLLDLRREFNFRSQKSPNLIVDYDDRMVKFTLKI
jgi:hypothetical protein